MPTTRIEIEQLGHAGWVGEVEVAGITAKRIHVTAESFGAIMNRVMDAYLGERPEEAPPPAPAPGPVPPVTLVSAPKPLLPPALTVPGVRKV